MSISGEGGSHHSKGAGRDGSFESHPVDIGIHTRHYAQHAHIYILPEFMLPLQNGRQEAKNCLHSGTRAFQVPACLVWQKYQKTRESPFTSARSAVSSLCTVYRRFPCTIVSSFSPVHPINSTQHSLEAWNSNYKELSQWHPTRQMANRMPPMDLQTRESSSS